MSENTEFIPNDKHDLDPNYSDVAPFTSEGGRVGLITCKRCGVSLLLDVRDTFSPVQLHDEYHNMLDFLMGENDKIWERISEIPDETQGG